MSPTRQALWWIAFFALFLILVYFLSSVLLPFVAGMALAYIFDPLCDWLERKGLGRHGATIFITIVIGLIFLAILMVLAPFLASQLTSFINSLPEMLEKIRQKFEPLYQQFQWRFHLPSIDRLISRSAGEVGSGLGWITEALGSLLLQGLAFANLLSLIVITPVVAFYLLRDWDHLIDKIDHLLPRNHAATIRELVREIDRLLAGFARGQASVCVILALIYGGGYFLVGVPFGFIIGVVAGVFSFIPYVGSMIGIVFALLSSLLSENIWLTAGLAMAVFTIGQLLEGNYLTPKLVGNKVRLHPVWVIFALLAFGSLFGFVGLLLAVPVAAAIGVLVRFAIDQYKKSRLYTGSV